jgi:ferredoxin-NADP reductase
MSVSNTKQLEVRLRQIRLEAEGIASYEFVAAGERSLPAFTAGSHIDLFLPRDMVRSYSLVNDPAETHRYVIAVQRDPDGRGGSSWMHAVPRVGDVMRISEPSNNFALSEDARQSVFIAGGIGITPIMSMASRLNRLDRAWRLHYAARSPQHAAFVHELQALDRPDRPMALCFGSTGGSRLNIAEIVREAPDDADLYCCGPSRMIDDFLSACSQRPAALVHYERFAANNEAATDGGFEIMLHRSRQRIEVLPGKTILDALLDNGVAVQYSCSAGVCGTCRTRVVEGEPDHRDDYLTEEEKQQSDSIMVCCSGSRSKTLVLDL